MTGKRLYECVTDALHDEGSHRRSTYYGDTDKVRNSFQFELVVGARIKDAETGETEPMGINMAPPAFAFLPHYEKKAWNAAAKRLTGRR